MGISRKNMDFIKRNQLIHRMLAQDLPRMHPSALKHAYLSAVANTMRNPVHSEIGPDNYLYTIGFGDVERTIPMLLIQDPNDKIVIHAHTPYPNKPFQRQMLMKLQNVDRAWAHEHGLPTRDIVRQIESDGVRQVSRRGLNRYVPMTLTHEERQDLARGKWYPTDPLSPEIEITHSGTPSHHKHGDQAKIERNITTSIDKSTFKSESHRVVDVEMEPIDHRSPMKIRNIEHMPTTSLDNELEM